MKTLLVKNHKRQFLISTGVFVFLFLFYLPTILLAQTFPTVPTLQKPKNFSQFVSNFINILNLVVFLVAGFGFFGMITGLLKYAGAGGDEEKLSKAKQLIAYGFLGLLIIYSFWGIAKLLANSYLGV